MRTGHKFGSWVIEWSDHFDPDLWDFVPHFPEIVLGHRVAITSFDSGPFEPTQDEYAKGWSKQESVAISPVVEDVKELPAVGFDEWYVYPADVPNLPTQSFVNRFGFAPLNEQSAETQEFWNQVVKCQPLHVIGAGAPTLFFATKELAILQKICAQSQGLIHLS